MLNGEYLLVNSISNKKNIRPLQYKLIKFKFCLARFVDLVGGGNLKI